MKSQNNGCLAAAPAATSRFTLRAGLQRRLIEGSDRLLDWIDRGRSRRELARLDDRMLHDIGVGRLDAEREARKPFWRA